MSRELVNFLGWCVIRGVVFVMLDRALVHDAETSFAFWCAFSLVDLVRITDGAVDRHRERDR